MLKRIRKWLNRRSYDAETIDALLTGRAYETATITKEQALNIPAVYTAIDFIGSTVASLPVKLYKTGGNTIKEVTDDYRLDLLNKETGDLLDSVQFKKAVIKDMLLDGAGYAYIDKNRNRITGLYYVDSQLVNVMEGVDKVKKSVKITIEANEYRDFEIFRITKDTKNGVTGRGLLLNNPVLLNAMYNSLKYENTAVSSGTKRGFLKSKYKLENKMLESLKSAWRKLYSTDVNNSPDVMVLNEGITFEPASSTATENQLNESKQTNTKLVYELFGLSESLFDGTKGNRDAYINNIKTGVLPIVEAFNTALNKFLLLEKEKGSYFFMLDTSSILQSSIVDRYSAYNTALEGGWMQVDEVRRMENLSPLDMDFVKMSLGNIFYYPKDKKIYTPNTNQLAEMNASDSESLSEPNTEGDNATDDKTIADTQNNAENGSEAVKEVNKDEN